MSIRLRYLYRAFRYRWRVDPAELRFVTRSLQPGQVAVDIGCHKGAYTYWMRRRVGPGGAVYAFEPQPKQVAYLREAFSAMHYDNVVLVPMAVSDSQGQLPLHLPEGAGRTHAATLEKRDEEREARSESELDPRSSLLAPRPSLVDVTTLDAFFAGRPHGPNLLKIDVEGHESAVLAGARQTLERFRPAVLVECEARHRADGSVRPVLGLFQSLDYDGYFFVSGERRPVAEFDPAVHQKLDPANPDKLPRSYVNNFAFVRRRMVTTTATAVA